MESKEQTRYLLEQRLLKQLERLSFELTQELYRNNRKVEEPPTDTVQLKFTGAQLVRKVVKGCEMQIHELKVQYVKLKRREDKIAWVVKQILIVGEKFGLYFKEEQFQEVCAEWKMTKKGTLARYQLMSRLRSVVISHVAGALYPFIFTAETIFMLEQFSKEIVEAKLSASRLKNILLCLFRFSLLEQEVYRPGQMEKLEGMVFEELDGVKRNETTQGGKEEEEEKKEEEEQEEEEEEGEENKESEEDNEGDDLDIQTVAKTAGLNTSQEAQEFLAKTIPFQRIASAYILENVILITHNAWRDDLQMFQNSIFVWFSIENDAFKNYRFGDLSSSQEELQAFKLDIEGVLEEHQLLGEARIQHFELGTENILVKMIFETVSSTFTKGKLVEALKEVAAEDIICEGIETFYDYFHLSYLVKHPQEAYPKASGDPYIRRLHFSPPNFKCFEILLKMKGTARYEDWRSSKPIRGCWIQGYFSHPLFTLKDLNKLIISRQFSLLKNDQTLLQYHRPKKNLRFLLAENKEQAYEGFYLHQNVYRALDMCTVPICLGGKHYKVLVSARINPYLMEELGDNLLFTQKKAFIRPSSLIFIEQRKLAKEISTVAISSKEEVTTQPIYRVLSQANMPNIRPPSSLSRRRSISSGRNTPKNQLARNGSQHSLGRSDSFYAGKTPDLPAYLQKVSFGTGKAAKIMERPSFGKF